MTDYSELKQLAEEATPGPWHYGGTWVSTLKGASIADCKRGDEKFIAAANPAAVLNLIAEVERLQFEPAKHCQRLVASLRKDLIDYQQGAKAEADAGDEARAEVRKLKAEVEALVKQGADYRSELHCLSTEIEALRQDAARYRWVLKNASLILDQKTVYQAETGFIKMDKMPAKSESHTAVTWAMSKEAGQ